VAVLQLVASRRGIAALPNWAIKNYVDYDYVIAARSASTACGATCSSRCPEPQKHKAYVLDFVNVIREQCAARWTVSNYYRDKLFFSSKYYERV
jgi:LysR family transcriptional regulator for metE and metH